MKLCLTFILVACEQAFSRAGWGEGKAKRALPPFPFPFLAIFPQTESLFTGYHFGGFRYFVVDLKSAQTQSLKVFQRENDVMISLLV